MWMVESNDRSKEMKMSIDRKLRPLMPRPISGGACCCVSNPNIWNHPICGLSDYGVRREIQAAVPLVSTRWNPTPEQLQALEEMYRRGIRTPSADQIQQIAAKLRRFGKIEGKNVFYWFQNHKARERQKKRRQLELLPAKKTHHADIQQTKETGLRRFEHQKLPTPSNSSTPPESAHRHKILTAKNEETCSWQLDLSSSLSPNTAHTPEKENQTLDLFPIRNGTKRDEDEEICIRHASSKFRGPVEFIEFLPTKKD